MRPDLSIVIPTLNEAENIGALLTQLSQQESIKLEIIVADGGSTDATAAIVADYPAKLVETAAGRGRQLNAGAAQATAPCLLFLHADSRLTSSTQLHEAITALGQQTLFTAGHFALQFTDYDSRNRRNYRFLEAKSRLNRPHTANGDQGLLIYRAWFEALGGYDENRHFLEDQEIGRKIRRDGHWITLPGLLQTSARRFETEGFRSRYTLMTLIMACWHCNWRPFFDGAVEVYKAQHQTTTLQLTPFIKVIRRELSAMHWRRREQLWYQMGDYARQNVWQLTFGLDVCLQEITGKKHFSPFLWLHDRLLGPLRHIRPLVIVTNLLCGLMARVWLFGLVCPWYAWKERRKSLKQSAS